MSRVYVSIGSNIDRERYIRAALAQLQQHYGPIEQSAVYESEAIGFDSEPFYNLVVGFDTSESPKQVSATLCEIEAVNGRTRDSSGLAARTLDLDLLLYDDLVLKEGKLSLPRDDITRYAFVLGPLAEIAGERRHPVSGQRFDALWSAFDSSAQELRRVWIPQVSE